MRTISATVEIKGKDPIPFSYEAPDTTEDCQSAFDAAKADGQVSDSLTYAEVFNYGLNLKIRAKIQSANSGEGQKKVRRSLTSGWVMSKGPQDLKDSLMAYWQKAVEKDTNKFLDRVYEQNEADITAK